MKKVLKVLAITVVSLILLFGVFLVYITLTDYKPKPIEPIAQAKGDVLNVYDTLHIFDWNVGYCGLGDDMSFFYDGGDRMRTTKERTMENLQGIINQMKSHDSIDFYMLQEVDRKSHRSYKINELDEMSKSLPDYHTYFALNYKVPFIPVPVSNPMGTVDGGIASFSKYEPFKVDRYAFEGNYAWPKGLFLLDRCYMPQRFYTSDGKELVLINTHNSAYDDGSLRKKQMKMLREFLLSEYEKGNYVLVSGDWNQNPPKPGQSSKESKEGHLTRLRIASDFMPSDWQWVYSEKIPSNRMIDKPYDPKTTITTTIDFFLLSPNLKATYLKYVDMEFKNSDHEPVLMNFAFIHE